MKFLSEMLGRGITMLNTYFENLPVTIVDHYKLEKLDSNIALVRLQNKRLALMVRNKNLAGQWEPFYPMGMETGFWDSRCYTNIDYNQVFENYRKLGANACWFMLHWSDVEPQRDNFDFRFADSILEAAKKQDIKICWVFFTHAHCNDPNLSKDDFWAYRLDSNNGKDHAVQWLKDDKGNIYDSIEKLNTVDQMEIFPCYSHPVVFERIQLVVKEIARHYRHSETVIGIQIGNEEGFLQAPLLDGYDSDFNPFTMELYEQWKNGGRSSWASFKEFMVKWWWRHFTTAFHEEDPYKLTTFNLFAGYPEKGGQEAIFRTGTDITTYGEGNVDAIGTMFYDMDCEPVWENIDRHYNCTCSLPIFIPSEIGLGIHATNSYVLSQHFLIKTLARGAQGFDIYAYGHFFNEKQEINAYGLVVKNWNTMIGACLNTIWSGLPGYGDIKLGTSVEGATINGLTGLDGAVVGILHFPEAWLEKEADLNTETADILVNIKVIDSGSYEMVVLRDGLVNREERLSLGDCRETQIHLKEVPKKSMSFIKIVRV